MGKQTDYPGIDIARMIAALAVIAIHTSPLGSFSETGDFLLTRIFARLAVPFFFVTSGFFLIGNYRRDAKKRRLFLRRIARIYAVAIVLYIPINLYNGYFEKENFLPKLLEDILFDGTMYHLWYLPASMMGAWIAWNALDRLSYRGAFALASLLYLVGLLGDSYYGLAEKIPVAKAFYDMLFQVMEQTRNGLFFAPIFFLMGGYLADRQKETSLRKSGLLFLLGCATMLAEGLALRNCHWQRHDSMYLSLVPTVYYLFSMLLCIRGKRRENLRTVSAVIYLIHPLVIVAVRGIAKFTHLQRWLIENSLLHYFAVCIVSVLTAFAVIAVRDRIQPKKKTHDTRTERAYLEVNLSNLRHNVRALEKEMPPECRLMAVVKAEAYGHGAYEVATCLEETGVRAFATATIGEAIHLRKCGISGEILILGYTAPERAREIRKYALTQTLIDFDHAVQFEKIGIPIRAHIKVDTGMHRLGLDVRDTELVARVFAMKHLNITGIFTHLCASDSDKAEDIAFTNAQITRFYHLLEALESRGIALPRVHIQSSYGLLNYPQLRGDYVRVGIALYGVGSAPNEKTKRTPDLKPVLSLKARVVLIRKIKRGETVGYGRAFTAQRDTLVAILPIGYADGYPRNLSCGNGEVLVNGQKAPIIGRICMDQLAIDVTDIRDVTVGSIATLIGKDGEAEITAPMLAENAQSITNELLSRMGNRLCICAKDAD